MTETPASDTLGRVSVYPLSKIVQDSIAAKGLTTVDAAALCDLPNSTLYAICSGERGARPMLPTLRKLSVGLGLDLDDLLIATGREPVGAPAEASDRQEKALIAAWRQLSSRDQRLITTLMKDMRNP